MTEKTFESLGLSEPLVRALVASGYTQPTPIQAQAIPPLLEGRDLLGLAETGTGKTAAFALPILQALAKITEPVAPRTCRALILAPTRELAIQIGESVATYGKNLNLRHAVVFGGVGSRPQMRAMDRGVDVLIATPGRLLDLMGTRHVNLHRLVFFVLDEADRMLDMGFIRDVKRIVKELPKVRQSLLFSATMPDDISSLAHEILHNPVRVEIARAGKTVDRIEQFVYFVDTKSKRAALSALLKDDALKRVIVFARTKHGADRVARGLGASGVGAYAIHGNKSQNARQAALESFRNGKVRVLVATDIAARGIDIDDITHVVNYDLPNVPESYVHRIGRTARAGNSGIAISLCSAEERVYLRDIERLTKKTITRGTAIEGLAEIAASLPPVPSKDNDRDTTQHFARDRGRVPQRRHMPATRPATAWHEGDAPRTTETAPRAHDGARGDRMAPEGRSHGGERSHQHGERPQRFGDRPAQPRGERPDGAREGYRGSRGAERSPAVRDGVRRQEHQGSDNRGPAGRESGHRNGGQRAPDHRGVDNRGQDNRGSEHRGSEHRGQGRPYSAERPRSEGEGSTSQQARAEFRGDRAERPHHHPRGDGGDREQRSSAPWAGRGARPANAGGRDGERSGGRDPAAARGGRPWSKRPSGDRAPAANGGHRDGGRGPGRWQSSDRPRSADRTQAPAPHRHKPE